MKIKCVLFGHKIHDSTDSGYEFCERCNSHEFYDGIVAKDEGRFDSWRFTIPNFYWRVRWHIASWWKYKFVAFFYDECCDCNKPSRILWKKTGKHDECLPF